MASCSRASRSSPLRFLWAEHPDGGGPGVFGDGVEMVRWRAFAEPPPEDDVDAIVLSGGATNVVDEPRLPWLQDELAWLRERIGSGMPILGVCLGAQLLTRALGAEVSRADPPEIGWHGVELTEQGREDAVLGALPQRFTALQWHSWQCALPEGAVALAQSSVCLQAFRKDRVWGVQFHPEVDRPTLTSWIDDYRSDPAAVAQGLDTARATQELDRQLPAWNSLGRSLFSAFRRTIT